jgi:hypothetical protein
MHSIFVGGIATGRYAMGSNEPLDTPSADYGTDSQESKTIIIIDGPDKPSPAPAAEGKRKRGGLADYKLQAFSSMTEAVKDFAQAIRDNKPTDIHLDLYNTAMNVIEYSQEALWRL